jgi:starch phosphorylase
MSIKIKKALGLNPHQAWFEQFQDTPEYKKLKDHPVAYFCAEYGMEGNLPFSGGLGILAGDTIKEAGDQKIPIVAIGLHYHDSILGAKNQTNLPNQEKFIPSQADLKLVLDIHKKPLQVKVIINDHDVFVQAWTKKINGINLFLLDTDINDNSPNDRKITNNLYDGNREIDIKQSMVIGIGGLKFLEAMGIHSETYHINEGHAAMMIFELIYQEMEKNNLSFEEAKKSVRHRIFYTNHTLTSGGNKKFDNDMVSSLLSGYAKILDVPVSELIKIGLIPKLNIFSLTMLSLRMASNINAVSKLHAQRAKEFWPEYTMESVTNGIHVRTWDMLKNDLDGEGSLWTAHQERKKILLEYIKKQTGQDLSTDHLLIGWARRFVLYKRPMVLFEDIKKLKLLAENSKKPIKIVVAGNPQKNHEEGLILLEKIKLLSKTGLKDILVVLPNYDIEMAKLLVTGCDVWLNTPIVGFEACGTSGMKAALNGVLPFSTKDGWVDEIEMDGKGWLIKNENTNIDLLETLQNKIVPLYYERNSQGIPVQWEEYMINSRKMILNDFCASRMLKEYLISYNNKI